MKKSYFAAVLTLICLLGVGISAHAQDTEGVSVKVPFEFVAGGATLPAGTYTVGRISIDASSGIAIRTNGHGAFALPMVVDGTPAKQMKLNFEHVGDKYFLSEVDTPAGTYTFPLPKAMVALAQAKDQGTVSSGGTN
jgi:hypothetical protein